MYAVPQCAGYGTDVSGTMVGDKYQNRTYLREFAPWWKGSVAKIRDGRLPSDVATHQRLVESSPAPSKPSSSPNRLLPIAHHLFHATRKNSTSTLYPLQSWPTNW